MSRIDHLRRQLRSLASRQRLNLRSASLARTVVAILLVASALFAVDFLFDLNPTQRLVAMLVAAVVLIHFVRKYIAAAYLPQSSVTQTALRNAPGDPSDLVAALQFSSEADASSGSLQLKQAVVAQVESAPINVFQNFRWSEARNAFFAMLFVGALATIAAVMFPTYASVFCNRLALGNRLYPKATEIVAVAVNSRFVLERQVGDDATPAAASCPQGKPVVIRVVTQGRWPDSGVLNLTSQNTGATRVVELTRLTAQQRAKPLRQATLAIRAAIDEPSTNPLSLAEIGDLVSVEISDLTVDAPDPPSSQRVEVLTQTLKKIEARLAELKNGPVEAVWACEIPRFVEAARYRLSIGDGRTSSGRLDLVELPVVDLDIRVKPPSYAGSNVAAPNSLARQFAVLEGSSVQLTLNALTNQRLRRAWLNVWQGENKQRISMAPLDDDRKTWRVPDDVDSPFSAIKGETRYEVMAEDINGYAIEKPLSGMIRVRPDRPPTGSAKVVHRVVLPSAEPVVSYRVNDDFGVAQARITAQVERRASRTDRVAEPGVSLQTSETEKATTEKKDFVVFETTKTKDQLPAKGRYTLQLAQLGLEKGDRLKLAIEVLDYRGENPGMWSSSEPVFLEISDESGVLAAISETDERSEQRLDDLIQRELGIGDEP